MNEADYMVKIIEKTGDILFHSAIFEQCNFENY
jgi:hypothetical protein